MENVKNFNEFITEVRQINPDFRKVLKEKPIKDSETIVVYHGFNQLRDALLTAKYGLSGKETAHRIYSYETGNNPKGLFVSIDFDKVLDRFSSSGVILEFSTKVKNLEAPVWVGGRGYFVQGEYTKSFKSSEEREEQRLKNREKHKESDDEQISKSDRPELAYSLFRDAEKQALFIGHLNPNMIRRFWVNERRMKENRYGGKWVRMDRKEFIKKYYNEDVFKQNLSMDKDRWSYHPSYLNKYNKVFRPADDFSFEILKKRLKELRGENYLDYYENIKELIDEYIKTGKAPYIKMEDLMFPKQLKQLEKIVKANL